MGAVAVRSRATTCLTSSRRNTCWPGTSRTWEIGRGGPPEPWNSTPRNFPAFRLQYTRDDLRGKRTDQQRTVLPDAAGHRRPCRAFLLKEDPDAQDSHPSDRAITIRHARVRQGQGRGHAPMDRQRRQRDRKRAGGGRHPRQAEPGSAHGRGQAEHDSGHPEGGHPDVQRARSGDRLPAGPDRIVPQPEYPARQAGQFRLLPFRHGSGEAGLGRPEHGRRPPAGQPALSLFPRPHSFRRGRDGRRPVDDRSVPCRCLQGQPGRIPGKGPGETEGVERPADERETVRRLSQALRVSGRRLRIHDHGIRRTQAGDPAFRRLHRAIDRDDQGIPPRRHPDHALSTAARRWISSHRKRASGASSFPTTWGRRRAPRIGSPSWTRRFRRS